ncbi:MAG TPA: DUF441 domain-containing protein [Clostridia bacterium]|nr:DUF441 domain-containing protein [Clostridia bacterium]
MWGETGLIFLIIIGILGKAPLIAIAACILMVLKLSHLTHYFPLIERRALEMGLLFLMLSVLTPLARGKFSTSELKAGLFSGIGLFAFLGGAVATHLNEAGLSLLQAHPELLFGLIIGSLIGIIFLGGIPVGPLMAAGLAALFIKIINFWR